VSEITIVDYAVGNLGSIQNMLKKIGVRYKLSSSPRDIEHAEKILLPGVGAFDAAIEALHQRQYFDVLNERVTRDGVPILGVCLGMQLLTEGSDEGGQKGFGWIKGKTHKFDLADYEGDLKVPHMGWNYIQPQRPDRIIDELDETSKFYFVHSYYVKCTQQDDVIARAEHGLQFDAIINKNNVYGAQFHPEKSHRFGMKLLSNFVHKI